MSNDEMRIVIAEKCGFVWYRHPSANSLQNAHYRFLANPAIHEFEQSPQWMVRADMTEKPCAMDYMAREFYIPDYPNDLNAMHEAEKTLEYPEAFASRLGPIIMRDAKEDARLWGTTRWHFEFTNATAHQRAEAFLRTIGKWKE